MWKAFHYHGKMRETQQLACCAGGIGLPPATPSLSHAGDRQDAGGWQGLQARAPACPRPRGGRAGLPRARELAPASRRAPLPGLARAPEACPARAGGWQACPARARAPASRRAPRACPARARGCQGRARGLATGLARAGGGLAGPRAGARPRPVPRGRAPQPPGARPGPVPRGRGAARAARELAPTALAPPARGLAGMWRRASSALPPQACSSRGAGRAPRARQRGCRHAARARPSPKGQGP